MYILVPYSDHLTQKLKVWNNLCLNKLSRGFWHMPKFGNHSFQHLAKGLKGVIAPSPFYPLCSFCCFCLVAKSRLTLCDPLDWGAPGSPSLSPGVCSNSCPLGWWCYPTILSSAFLFSSCPQSFPSSSSFPMSQLFASGDQSIRASASAPVPLMNIQGWSPLGWTGWISLQSKGLSRVFSSTTVQKH